MISSASLKAPLTPIPCFLKPWDDAAIRSPRLWLKSISSHYKLPIRGIMLWQHKMDSDSSSRVEAETLHLQQVPKWWSTIEKQRSGAKYLLQLDPIKLGTGFFFDLGHSKARPYSGTSQLCIGNGTSWLRRFFLKLLAFLIHLCPASA